MKFLLAGLSLVSMAGAAAPDPMQTLSRVMAGAQQGLQQAEHRHGKLVKAVRKQADAFLQDEANAYGKFLSRYSDQLAQAEDEVKDATRLAEAGVAKAAAASQKANDWKPNDPALKLRVKLSSEASSTDMIVKRAERKNKRQLKEAEEHAQETLDGESEKLGMKVGDMTPLVDKAKKNLEAVAEHEASQKNASAATIAVQANLSTLEANLVKAKADSNTKIAEATKGLKDFLSAEDKDVVLKLTKMTKSVDADAAAPVAVAVPVKVVPLKSAAKSVSAEEKVAAAAAPAKAATVVKVATPGAVAFLKQDPCAGCDTGLAQAYQTCAMKHGNPCAETNAAGIVGSGPGQKKDIGCCMKKEKHDRCLQCSSMDCAHKTCNVNKKYYNTYTVAEKFDDKKAMKKAGWGK